MQIFSDETDSRDVIKNLEKEYKKARAYVDQASRDFFKIAALIKDCFIERMAKIDYSDFGFGLKLYIGYEPFNNRLYYATQGFEQQGADQLRDSMLVIYKDVISELKRNRYTLEKGDKANSIDIFNKKDIRICSLRKVLDDFNDYTFYLDPIYEEVKDTTKADDRVIKQMLQICPKIEREIQIASATVMELFKETGVNRYSYPDEIADQIDMICEDANKYMEKLLDMSEKIKNDEVRQTIYSAIKEFCEGPVNRTLQTWAEESGWDNIVGDLEAWADGTLGSYLRHHDLSVFD